MKCTESSTTTWDWSNHYRKQKTVTVNICFGSWLNKANVSSFVSGNNAICQTHQEKHTKGYICYYGWCGQHNTFCYRPDAICQAQWSNLVCGGWYKKTSYKNVHIIHAE